MTAPTCPWGTELQPGASGWFETTRAVLMEMFGATGPFIIAALAPFYGVMWDVNLIVANGPFEYPTLTLATFSSPQALGTFVGDWIKARIWDLYGQCKSGPPEQGCTFNPNTPDTLTLDNTNAVVTQEPIGGSTPVTLVGANCQARWPGGYLGLPSGSQHGDYILITFGCTLQSISPVGQPMDILGTYQSAGQQIRVWGGFYTAQWTNNPWVEVPGGTGYACCWAFRGVDPSTPVSEITSAVLPGAGTISVPAITIENADSAVVFCVAASTDQPSNNPSPAMTLAGWGHVGSHFSNHYYALGKPAGEYGPQELPCPGSTNSVGVLLAVHGTAAATGDVFNWDQDDEEDWAWGVDALSQAYPEGWDIGNVGHGYHIEERFPQTAGGTLEDNEVEFTIMPYDQGTFETQEETSSDHMPILVHLCNWRRAPAEPPELPEGYEEPLPEPGETLHDIALALQELERKCDFLLNYCQTIEVNTDPLLQLLTGTVGRQGEEVSGTFYERVWAALQALGEKPPVGYSSTLVAGDVTGDNQWASDATLYRVQCTTIPQWSGYRAGSPNLYEVNSRRDQLGWAMFKASDGYTPWQLLVWPDSLIISSVEAPAGFSVHLAPGVHASVYRLVPYW